MQKLEPYFGQKVQFPLETSIPVKKGQVVGLTVPTWAPALTQLLSDGSSWRASRPKGGCDDTEKQTAQTPHAAAHAVPLPLQGAAHLQRDADHDAEAEQAAEDLISAAGRRSAGGAGGAAGIRTP